MATQTESVHGMPKPCFHEWVTHTDASGKKHRCCVNCPAHYEIDSNDQPEVQPVDQPQGDPNESILLEAERLINGQRASDYGSVLESFSRIASLWEPILGCRVNAQQVALCMIQLKISRYMNNMATGAGHRDSIVDIAGYAGCLEKIHNEMTIEGEKF